MNKNPSIRLFVLLTSSMFISEFLIMLTFNQWLPDVSVKLAAGVDALLLVLITTPILHIFLVKPMTKLVNDNIKSNANLRVLAQAFEVNEGILITDCNFNIIRANNACTTITGFKTSYVLGKSLTILGKVFAELFQNEIKNELNMRGDWSGISAARTIKGSEIQIEISITEVKNKNGTLSEYVCILSDVTSKLDSEYRIKQLAYVDQITGLANINQLIIDIEKSFLSEDYLQLIILAPDNFSALTDSYSYIFGEYFLRKITLRLKRELSVEHSLYKLHDNKFAIFIGNSGKELISAEQSIKNIDMIIKSIFSTPFSINGYEHYSSASVGVVLSLADEYSAEDLITYAQISSNQAARLEGNSLVYYDKTYKAKAQKQIELQNQLHLAVSNQELDFYYQPQVDAKNRLIGAEALVRWNHPVWGIILPEKFIPMAEETLLIENIGNYLLKLGFKRLIEWAKNDHTCHLTLSVNVTAKQFHKPSFLQNIDDLFKKYPINPSKLILELTESISVEDMEYVSLKMKTLKEKYHIKLSLDDFGTGYSSLSYLQSMPFDEIKIDRCFVQDITSNPKNASIVKSIIALAKIYNFEVIAEGVETQEECHFLKNIGCEHFQGYFFSKPVPLEQFNMIATKYRGDLFKKSTSKVEHVH
ncbi:MAG: EAL domain-containing protein [Methylococcales bacterium]|nr:EAL domain-containing protein [Methylococcales bacterium]